MGTTVNTSETTRGNGSVGKGSNIPFGMLPPASVRTFESVIVAFRAAGEQVEGAATSAIDMLGWIIECSVPQGNKPPIITERKQVATCYDNYQEARAAKSKANYKAPTKKDGSYGKQIDKLASGLTMASNLPKDAIRIYQDTKDLILGNVNTGDAGVGGKVYGKALRVIGKQNQEANKDKPFTKAQIKELVTDKDKAEATVNGLLKALDAKMLKELGKNSKSPPTLDSLPKPVREAFGAFHSTLEDLIAAYPKKKIA